MSTKRPLLKKELLFVILDKDVKVDGTLKKKARVHIARIPHRNGKLSTTACGLDHPIRWVYSYYPSSLIMLISCPECAEITQKNMGEFSAEIVNKESPASNTGVN